MYRFFVAPDQIGEETIRIEGSDVNHIKNVLRMKPGEQVRICTGEDDAEYRCALKELEEEQIIASILWVDHPNAELPSKITLFQGLPKSDKLELIIQKAVELGAASVVPVSMARSIVKLDAKKAQAKEKRWNAISESAAKQSKRMLIPPVMPLCGFREALEQAKTLDRILLPYELAGDMQHTREVLAGIRPGEQIGIFIGPEGGFERSEVEALEAMGAQTITLGRRILRTETAGLAILSMLTLMLEERE